MIRLFQKVITNWGAQDGDENTCIYEIQPLHDSEVGNYSAYAVGIGIQGPTGLRFKLNTGSDSSYWLPLASEPIRLGSTGIYELDLQDLNGVTINKIIVYKVLGNGQSFNPSEHQPIIIDLLYDVQKNVEKGVID